MHGREVGNHYRIRGWLIDVILEVSGPWRGRMGAWGAWEPGGGAQIYVGGFVHFWGLHTPYSVDG